MEQALEARCVGIFAAGLSKEHERLRHGEQVHMELGYNLQTQVVLCLLEIQVPGSFPQVKVS